MKFRPFSAALAAACLAAAPFAARAREKKPAPPDEKTELAELLDDARAYAVRTAKPDAALKLHEPPLLNFTNPDAIKKVYNSYLP